MGRGLDTAVWGNIALIIYYAFSLLKFSAWGFLIAVLTIIIVEV